MQDIKNRKQGWIANLKYIVDGMLELKSAKVLYEWCIASQYQFRDHKSAEGHILSGNHLAQVSQQFEAHKGMLGFLSSLIKLLNQNN